MKIVILILAILVVIQLPGLICAFHSYVHNFYDIDKEKSDKVITMFFFTFFNLIALLLVNKFFLI